MAEYKKVGYLLYRTGKVHAPGTRVFGEEPEIFAWATHYEVDSVRVITSEEGHLVSDHWYLPENGEWVDRSELHPRLHRRPKN